MTLDEALFYVEDCKNGKRRICYVKRGQNVPSRWVLEKKESFQRSFMVVGAMSGRGTLPLIRVPKNVKINSKFYIDNVLKPLVEIHIPSLYGNETSRVIIHHDKASSHTSKLTQGYAKVIEQNTGIRLLPNKEIPVKSPDASPMDFYGFGALKQRLVLRRASTLDGVWKVLNEEWNRLTPLKCRNVFAEWKRRLRIGRELKGHHIESTPQIHKRKVK